MSTAERWWRGRREVIVTSVNGAAPGPAESCWLPLCHWQSVWVPKLLKTSLEYLIKCKIFSHAINLFQQMCASFRSIFRHTDSVIVNLATVQSEHFLSAWWCRTNSYRHFKFLSRTWFKLFAISTCIQISNPKCSAVLWAKTMLTSDFSVKGHTNTTHSVVSRGSNLTGTPCSMSAKTQEEKI